MQMPTIARPKMSAPMQRASTRANEPAHATSAAKGWGPSSRKPDAGAALLKQPLAQFEAKAKNATVRELVTMRDALKPAYLEARRDETRAKNEDVIRRWDTLEHHIEKKSGASGGE